MLGYAVRIAAVPLLLSLALVAGGCGDGGGGDPTPEEYFERVAEIGDEFNTTGEELQIQFQDDIANATSEEETVDVLRDFIGATIDAFETFVADADDLDPPEAATAAHDASVSAARAVIELLDDVDSDLEGASTEEAAVAIVNDFLTSGAPDEFEQSCFDLQAVADDEGIDVDLGCGS